MKKNCVIMLMAIIIVCLLVVVISTNYTAILNSLFPGKKQLIEYGDDFLQVTYYDGNTELNISKIESSYKLVFYLHADCSSCIEMLPLVERLNRVFFGSDLKIILLWENEIPTKELKNYNLESFSLHNTRLDNIYGSLFLVDETNKVIFKDNKQFNSLVLKLFDLSIFDKTQLINNTNRYIVDYYGNEQTDKPTLVYFHMIGCPDCEAVDPIINSTDIIRKYNIVTISVEKNVAKGSNNIYMDDMKLYKHIYSIDWYPSFLIIQGDEYKFIGEIGNEELLNELLQYQ